MHDLKKKARIFKVMSTFCVIVALISSSLKSLEFLAQISIGVSLYHIGLSLYYQNCVIIKNLEKDDYYE